jgi:hypothetical protein
MLHPPVSMVPDMDVYHILLLAQFCLWTRPSVGVIIVI